MKFESTIDLVKVYANIDQSLVNACACLEKAIQAYGVASDTYADAVVIYRKEKACKFKKLKDDKVPATLIKEMVAGETADLKGEVLTCEAQKKQCQMYISLFEHRINTLKFIGKKTAPIAGDNN